MTKHMAKAGMRSRGTSGVYRPLNPEKYRGDSRTIIYRSKPELTLMRHFDTSPTVLEWSSEEHPVPYHNRVDDKLHTYYPDFLIKVLRPDGGTETIMIEYKPRSQASAPERGTKTEKRYIAEVMEWGKNSSKWEAATRYCASSGWKFRVLTEREVLGGR